MKCPKNEWFFRQFRETFIPLLLAHTSFISSAETVDAVLPSLRWPKLPDFLLVLLGWGCLCFLSYKVIVKTLFKHDYFVFRIRICWHFIKFYAELLPIKSLLYQYKPDTREDENHRTRFLLLTKTSSKSSGICVWFLTQLFPIFLNTSKIPIVTVSTVILAFVQLLLFPFYITMLEKRWYFYGRKSFISDHKINRKACYERQQKIETKQTFFTFPGRGGGIL